jgi:hypothetical protein
MGSGWRDPDDIVEDLASGDAERIRIGIAGLREFTRAGDEFDLPAVEPWVLRPLGESPPEDTVTDLARLLAHYRSFVPQPSRAYVVRQLVELAVRYAVPQVVYEASLQVQGHTDPAAAARDAVGYLRARGLATPREIDAAQTLIAYLLEAKPVVRRAATEALAGWPPTQVKQAIVAAVLPLADPDQRALLASAERGAAGVLPAVAFQDATVNRQERYTLGTERNSGRHYVSIPASNGLIDYAEYYEIDGDTFERYRADPARALEFVIRCRNRYEDPRLMYQPSTHRGSAT